jgi:hypothetical protein
VLTAYSLKKDAFNEGHRYSFEHVSAAENCLASIELVIERSVVPNSEELVTAQNFEPSRRFCGPELRSGTEVVLQASSSG